MSPDIPNGEPSEVHLILGQNEEASKSTILLYRRDLFVMVQLVGVSRTVRSYIDHIQLRGAHVVHPGIMCSSFFLATHETDAKFPSLHRVLSHSEAVGGKVWIETLHYFIYLFIYLKPCLSGINKIRMPLFVWKQKRNGKFTKYIHLCLLMQVHTVSVCVVCA